METFLQYPNIPQQPTKFIKHVVAVRKDRELKIRLQTLILTRGISEKEFYKKLDLSRQAWYVISWGIWEPNDWLKIKICKELNVDSRVIWPAPL